MPFDGLQGVEKRFDSVKEIFATWRQVKFADHDPVKLYPEIRFERLHPDAEGGLLDGKGQPFRRAGEAAVFCHMVEILELSQVEHENLAKSFAAAVVIILRILMI